MKSGYWFVYAFVFLGFSHSQGAEAEVERTQVQRVDGSPISLEIIRDDSESQVPLLLLIDGSLCVPSLLGASMQMLLPESSGVSGYAVGIVEKTGVTSPEPDEDGGYSFGPDFECSDEFRRYYSIDHRVTDHLRAIQHLRRHADWWDGRLFIWGHSDGGRIGGRVAAFTPETERMVLGGFGGGERMATEFKDFHICRDDRVESRSECVSELESQFQDIRDNPTPLKTWMGSANSWQVWSTRLDAVEANVLEDVTVPLLIYHGTEDQSTPVSSARALIEHLNHRAEMDLVYHEIEGMGHGLGSGLSAETRTDLHQGFLSWLLFGDDEVR